jgi:hypothetical protein
MLSTSLLWIHNLSRQEAEKLGVELGVPVEQYLGQLAKEGQREVECAGDQPAPSIYS